MYWENFSRSCSLASGSLTGAAIIPRARMGFESIAHDEAGYWLSGHEGERNIIVLVKSN